MTYKEIQALEKAFPSFLTKLKRQGDIRIRFYEINGREFIHEFAYIGYRTQSGGRFGLHFNPKRKSFSFGERNKEEGILPFSIHFRHQDLIPGKLKELFSKVIERKKSTNILKSEWLE
jgi:hypothetical protein